MPDTTLNQRQIYTVSQLNQQSRELLEETFRRIWVEGEITNLAQASSGHSYFSLKESGAQLRCALFRARNRYLSSSPQNGLKVMAMGRVSLYEPRGDYQFIVEQIEELGSGALQRAFEQLKQKLASEGLFDPDNKQPIPSHPQRLGVITSAKGAALQDVLQVLKRRYPALPVLVYPTQVQGKGAAAEIAATITLADHRRDCDLLLLVRGGGSLEDLWSFNEEEVARAIAACSIPLISGVGHEIDFTIADFVADLRAPTPSAAAELASPQQSELQQQINQLRQRLQQNLLGRLRESQTQLQNLLKRLRLQHPERQIQQQSQHRDELELRLIQAQRQQLRWRRQQLEHHSALLVHYTPQRQIERLRQRLEQFQHQLHEAQRQRLDHARQRLLALSRTLHAVSPLATLERGYTITRRLDDRCIISDPGQLQPGEQIETLCANGRVISRVEASQTEVNQQP